MLQSELPERQPRFVLYSFELDHGDGRVSYPMCLIWSTPIGCKTDLQMMYAGTKLPLVKEAGITKVFEIRELDELTDEWLESRMRGKWKYLDTFIDVFIVSYPLLSYFDLIFDLETNIVHISWKYEKLKSYCE